MGAACSAQRRVDVESPSPAPTPAHNTDSAETINFGSSPGTRPPVSDFDESERLSGCGHVLILYCSIKEFAADAVLFPDTWTAGINGVPAWKDEAESRDINGRLVYRRPLIPRRPGGATPRREGTNEEEHASIHKEVADFVKAAGMRLNGTSSIFKRAKPLIAVPLPGVGEVDPDDVVPEQGQFVKDLLPLLYSAANRFGVDYAVTSTEAGAYSVMQVLRSPLCPWRDGPFWMLSAKQLRHAKRLCRETLQERIAVFFGAGVSLPSGLPTWQGLLTELQQQLVDQGKMNTWDMADMQELGVLDQATLIEMEMGGAALKTACADIVNKGFFTPAHSLLGALRVSAITTNYDSLFEKAQIDSVMRLPWDAPLLGNAEVADASKKLLKLHGCVTRPQSIVLTRQDYLRYGDEREALRGLVSRSLLEKELLIVGFSMTDDNMHNVIDRCRKVWNHGEENASTEHGMDAAADNVAWRHRKTIRSKTRPKTKKMGTILTLVANSMFTKLWSQDFHVVAMCAEDAEDAATEGVNVAPRGANCFAYGAWIHDCFLDHMNHLLEVDRAHDSFILDSRYASMLDKQQEQVRKALQPLIELYNDDELRQSETWPTIVQILEKVGQKFDYSGEAAKPIDVLPVSPLLQRRQPADAYRASGSSPLAPEPTPDPSDAYMPPPAPLGLSPAAHSADAAVVVAHRASGPNSMGTPALPEMPPGPGPE